MVDVAVSAQLQQWTFEKSTSIVRPERSDSAATTPDLYNHDETLRIDTSAVEAPQDLDTNESLFQDKYLSSEEDLSPMEPDSDEESIHEFEVKCFEARRMSVSRFEKGKSCDMAVVVSYVSAGRPKMIDLENVSSPIEKKQRSASLALEAIPTAAAKLRMTEASSRLSLTASSTSRSTSPADSSRRPSTGHLPFTHGLSSLRISDSSSSLADSSALSNSSTDEAPIARPVSAAAALHLQPSARSSVYSNLSPLAPFPPLTPQSPGPHSFLSSDPYENANTSAASPIIKSAPHKRLRSISQKLSLAKIAISPSTKKWDSRRSLSSRGGTMPPTPATPYTPMTPQTAPAPSSTFSSPKNRLRRNSRLSSKATSERGPSPEVPPVPILSAPPPGKNTQKMVARGANERAPPLELPPFPDDDGSTPAMEVKTRRIRKRKSLMDLL